MSKNNAYFSVTPLGVSYDAKRLRQAFHRSCDGDCNWIAVQTLTAPMRVQAKIRYGQKAQPATLFPDENGTVIEFDEPQRAISPGQATVWYDGDVVVGGGTIIKSL